MNPLLRTSFSSARAFSTAPLRYAETAFADIDNPDQDHVTISVDGKHIVAKPSKKRPNPSSPKAKQAKEKPRLLRELSPEKTPTADVPQDEPATFDNLTREALADKLANLEAKLAATQDFDWRELYREAQEQTSLKNDGRFKGLSAHGKQTQLEKNRNAFKAKIADIKMQKSDQNAAVQRLEESIAALKSYLAKVTAGEGKSLYDAEVDEATRGERLKKLEEINRKKEVLLKRRDELAVKMAQLKATSTTSTSSAIEASAEAEATTDTQRPAAQQPDPSDPSSAQPSILNTNSLRLHLPRGKLRISDDLTIDINAPTKFIRRQIIGLQTLLKQFHPPLDQLPSGLKGAGNHRHMNQTWLKILLSRYQAKTGVTGVIEQVEDGEQKAREKRFIKRELNVEAVERVAARLDKRSDQEKRFNASGKAVPEMTTEERRYSGEKNELRQTARPDSDHDYDHDEMGFLRNDAEAGNGVDIFGEPLDKPAPGPQPQPTVTMWDSGVTDRTEAGRRKTVDGRRMYSTSSRAGLGEIYTSLAELNKGLEQKEKAHENENENENEVDNKLEREGVEAQTPSASISPPPTPPAPHLPHLTPTGTAHMVSITTKSHTSRTAIAVGTVYFSNATPLGLITSNSLKKGDVLGVSRIAGIMAAKKCPDIVPLCHPITLTHVGVELRTFGANKHNDAAAAAALPPNGADNMAHGGVQIECKVSCTGATGVEMEALTAVMGAALSVVDMCKAVDKFQRIGDVRVVLKEGGKSGVWREESWRSWQEQ